MKPLETALALALAVLVGASLANAAEPTTEDMQDLIVQRGFDCVYLSPLLGKALNAYPARRAVVAGRTPETITATFGQNETRTVARLSGNYGEEIAQRWGLTPMRQGIYSVGFRGQRPAGRVSVLELGGNTFVTCRGSGSENRTGPLTHS